MSVCANVEKENSGLVHTTNTQFTQNVVMLPIVAVVAHIVGLKDYCMFVCAWLRPNSSNHSKPIGIMDSAFERIVPFVLFAVAQLLLLLLFSFGFAITMAWLSKEIDLLSSRLLCSLLLFGECAFFMP